MRREQALVSKLILVWNEYALSNHIGLLGPNITESNLLYTPVFICMVIHLIIELN